MSRIKIKNGGSDAGHNGLKSIDMNIGKNYNRVRIGIGNSSNLFKAKDYVLGKFSKSEFSILEKIGKNHEKHNYIDFCTTSIIYFIFCINRI